MSQDFGVVSLDFPFIGNLIMRLRILLLETAMARKCPTTSSDRGPGFGVGSVCDLLGNSNEQRLERAVTGST